MAVTAAGWLAVLLVSAARAQEAAKLVPPPPPPRFVNLLQADLSTDQGLRLAADRLRATAQLFTRRPPKPGSPPETRAHPPADEGGEALTAVCTGSFIAPTWLVTADHCIMRDREDVAGRVVVRRHLFGITGGRLVRSAYQDYALTGRTIAQVGDLVVLELARAVDGGPRFRLPGRRWRYRKDAVFHALGFPNHSYGVPFVSVGCRITGLGVEDHLGGRGYQGDCPAEGGMSGGPQFEPSGRQIGIVTITQDLGRSSLNISPMITALPPP